MPFATLDLKTWKGDAALLSPSKAKAASDWPKAFTGEGVRFSFAMRAAKAGGVPRLEVATGDGGAWSYQGFALLGKAWTRYDAAIRFDWNDAEAEAAGWRRSPSGFSWRDTVGHMGRLVVAAPGVPAFDLKEAVVETAFDR